MDFPANLCIRPLTISDLIQVEELEAAVLPEDRCASKEILRYRLTVAPELCCGLFFREYIPEFNQVNLPEVAERINKEHHDHVHHAAIQPDEPGKSSVVRETLVGHVLATKIRGSKIPADSTELLVEGKSQAGHDERSRIIGIHSVCVSSEWKRRNLGTLMLHDYIQKLSNQDLGDQIVLVCDLDMVNFYAKIGFVQLDESEQLEGGRVNMTIDLIPEEI